MIGVEGGGGYQVFETTFSIHYINSKQYTLQPKGDVRKAVNILGVSRGTLYEKEGAGYYEGGDDTDGAAAEEEVQPDQINMVAFSGSLLKVTCPVYVSVHVYSG